MIDPLVSLAHTIATAPGTQAVLLGSGVSRSAQVPTGWEVTLDLVRRVAAGEGVAPKPDEAAWYVARFGHEPNYSTLMGELAKTAAERRALLQTYFEASPEDRETGAKMPTPAHRAVAALVAGGFVKVILTTNFDRLIETALRDEGIEPTVIATADAADGAAPLVHQRCVVVKLHGDYLDDRIKNTEVEVAAYDPRMDRYLDQVLDEFGLIVCGWSAEWDPALRAAIERCKSRRYTTSWVSLAEPGPQAQSLIKLRQAQVIVTAGADKFFPELADKVASIVAIGSAPPLSVSAAVASLKRFVAEERYRVRLEDLLLDEVALVVDRLQSNFLVQGGPPPTAELTAERIRKYDAQLETLRALFFHGCRLSKLDQVDQFLRIIPMLGPKEPSSGYTIWVDLARYPMATIFYAAALGLITSGQFAPLRRLMNLRYRFDGSEFVACDRLSAPRALPEFAAQSLYPRRHTPASDHLLALLEPLARPYCVDAQALFEELEVWVSLANIDLQDLSQENVTMPRGRFCWHFDGGMGASGRILAQAEECGANWTPLREGWFYSNPNRWKEVKDAFVVVRNRIAERMH